MIIAHAASSQLASIHLFYIKSADLTIDVPERLPLLHATDIVISNENRRIGSLLCFRVSLNAGHFHCKRLLFLCKRAANNPPHVRLCWSVFNVHGDGNGCSRDENKRDLRFYAHMSMEQFAIMSLVVTIICVYICVMHTFLVP